MGAIVYEDFSSGVTEAAGGLIGGVGGPEVGTDWGVSGPWLPDKGAYLSGVVMGGSGPSTNAFVANGCLRGYDINHYGTFYLVQSRVRTPHVIEAEVSWHTRGTSGITGEFGMILARPDDVPVYNNCLHAVCSRGCVHFSRITNGSPLLDLVVVRFAPRPAEKPINIQLRLDEARGIARVYYDSVQVASYTNAAVSYYMTNWSGLSTVIWEHYYDSDSISEEVRSYRLAAWRKTGLPPIVEIEPESSNKARISWHSATHLVYQPQVRSGGSGLGWVDLGPPLTGTGRELSISDIASATCGMYRVRVLPDDWALTGAVGD